MARRVIKEKRRQCWRQFVSSINNRTPLSKVWRLIRRLKGKGGGGNAQHLKLSDTVLTTDEIAETLAETFAHNSSSDNCLPQFIPLKHRQEKQKLKFYSEIYNNEEYNQLFTMEELRRSLNRSRDTAVGPGSENCCAMCLFQRSHDRKSRSRYHDTSYPILHLPFKIMSTIVQSLVMQVLS